MNMAEELLSCAQTSSDRIRDLERQVQLLTAKLHMSHQRISDLQRDNMLLMRALKKMGASEPLSFSGGGDSRG